jgi:hypothetical protein
MGRRVEAAARRLTLDRAALSRSSNAIHQGGPDKGLRYCWLLQRSDPLNLIQFILA